MDAQRRLDRSGHLLAFDDGFAGGVLDDWRWVAAYLPHWSTPDRAAARYEIRDGTLRLRIDADQQPWCPPLDGDVRVSSIQTATFSGPIGSRVGTHPFHPDGRVVTPQPPRFLFTPTGGLIEVRLRASNDAALMVALWMIGIGDEPERSGEICVAEIFGTNVEAGTARVGMGIHPFEDPLLRDDFAEVELAVDVRDDHLYSVDWQHDRVDWYVDDRHVRTVHQSPRYPLQLMLGLYEFPTDGAAGRRPGDYPKVVEVDQVRAYRPRASADATDPVPDRG